MDAIKYTSTLLFLVFLMGSLPALGQDSHLRKKIFLRPGANRFDSVLIQVAHQTEIIFSFNSKKLNTKKEIMVPSSLRTLSDFLEFLKKERKLTVKVIENYVLISIPSLKDKLIKISGTQNAITPEVGKNLTPIEIRKPASGNDLMNVSGQDTVKTDTSQQIIVKEKRDTLESTALQDQLTVSHNRSDTANLYRSRIDSLTTDAKLIEPPIKKTIPTTTQSLSNPNSKKEWFIKSGASVDESSFTGITTQIGVPTLYLTTSVNSNLLTAHFRYGLGSSFKLDNRLRLHLAANYGSPERTGYFIDSVSNRHSIAVKSDLLRMGAGLEVKWKKFSAQIMINYNLLNTTYFIDNAASDLHAFKKEGDNLFYAIKPAYLMSNTFSEHAASNTKTWVGLQLNLLYTIHSFGKK